MTSSPPPPSWRPQQAAMVDAVDKRIRDPNFSTGALAELRRVHPDAPFTPTLWRLLLTHHDCDPPPADYNAPGANLDLNRDYERRWAAVFGAMALTVGQHDARHPFGAALAEAGWSELRLVRLLEARDDDLFETLRRLARFMASRGGQLDWADGAALAHETDPARRRALRQRIARSYYTAAHHRNTASSPE